MAAIRSFIKATPYEIAQHKSIRLEIQKSFEKRQVVYLQQLLENLREFSNVFELLEVMTRSDQLCQKGHLTKLQKNEIHAWCARALQNSRDRTYHYTELCNVFARTLSKIKGFFTDESLRTKILNDEEFAANYSKLLAFQKDYVKNFKSTASFKSNCKDMLFMQHVAMRLYKTYIVQKIDIREKFKNSLEAKLSPKVIKIETKNNFSKSGLKSTQTSQSLANLALRNRFNQRVGLFNRPQLNEYEKSIIEAECKDLRDLAPKQELLVTRLTQVEKSSRRYRMSNC